MRLVYSWGMQVVTGSTTTVYEMPAAARARASRLITAALRCRELSQQTESVCLAVDLAEIADIYALRATAVKEEWHV